MKARELIDVLASCDPEAEVLVAGDELAPVFEVRSTNIAELGGVWTETNTPEQLDGFQWRKDVVIS